MRPALVDEGILGTSITSVRKPEQRYSEADAASGCYPPAGTLKFSDDASGLLSEIFSLTVLEVWTAHSIRANHRLTAQGAGIMCGQGIAQVYMWLVQVCWRGGPPAWCWTLCPLVVGVRVAEPCDCKSVWAERGATWLSLQSRCIVPKKASLGLACWLCEVWGACPVGMEGWGGWPWYFPNASVIAHNYEQYL